MDPIHKKTLNGIRTTLVNDLYLKGELYDLLLEKGIFNVTMMDYIMAESSERAQKRKMIDDLQRRGPKAYNLFLECLEKSEQKHIADIIRSKEEELRNVERNKHTMVPSDHQIPAPMYSEDSIFQPDVPEKNMSSNNAYYASKKKKYKMESNPRGICLIINNEEFQESEVRDGTHIDKDNLRDLFHSFGFYVCVRENLEAEVMRKTIENLSNLPKLHEVDCLVVAILSHGHMDSKILGSDEKYLRLNDDVYPHFSSSKCKALLNKPKIFIINSCRGEKNKGKIVLGGTEPDNNMKEDISKPVPCSESADQICSDFNDFLIIHSTFDDHVSYRDSEKGSCFITELVNVLKEKGSRKNSHSMLQEVRTKLTLQTPIDIESLSRYLYFNPMVDNSEEWNIFEQKYESETKDLMDQLISGNSVIDLHS